MDEKKATTGGDVTRRWWEEAILKLLLKRLKKKERYTPGEIRIHGWNLAYPDSASFLSTYKSIFQKGMYRFPSDKESPVILDCGANIGLSVLFFKKEYPSADITAFEPDPHIFQYLKRNVHGNGFTDVRLIEKAVWSKENDLEFFPEGADGSRIAMDGDPRSIQVPAVKLGDFLDREVDFLKLDIEGGEDEVIPHIADSLSRVRYLFLEYHSFAHREQNLAEILHMIKEQGFRIHLHPEIISDNPFHGLRLHGGMDMQLNIFCWRTMG